MQLTTDELELIREALNAYRQWQNETGLKQIIELDMKLCKELQRK